MTAENISNQPTNEIVVKAEPMAGQIAVNNVESMDKGYLLTGFGIDSDAADQDAIGSSQAGNLNLNLGVGSNTQATANLSNASSANLNLGTSATTYRATGVGVGSGTVITGAGRYGSY